MTARPELADVVRVDPAARRPVPPLTVAQAYRHALHATRRPVDATPAAHLSEQLAAAARRERAALAALTA